MTSWTLVVCEGIHDQKAIAALLRMCGGWREPDKVPSKLPVPLRETYPQPGTFGKGNQPTPDYLLKSGRYFVIRAMGSKDSVLGKTAMDYLGQFEPNAVGAIVDANDAGVADREKKFRDVYSQLYAHAADVKAGGVVPGSPDGPALGLWVAPDNRKPGRMDDALLQAAKRAEPELVDEGKRFVDRVDNNEPGVWSGHRTKALLGVVYQTVNPGASLAVSLRDSSCWFDEGLSKIEPFKTLLGFLDKLTGT